MRCPDALDEIADTLPRIMHALVEARPLRAREWELTLAQMRALRVIGERADCTMGELARRLGISLSAATGLADRLVQQRLVERQGHPRDRRLVCLRLSRVGRRAHAAVMREKRRQMRQALGHFSTAQLERIAAALALLRDALDAAAVRSTTGVRSRRPESRADAARTAAAQAARGRATRPCRKVST